MNRRLTLIVSTGLLLGFSDQAYSQVPSAVQSAVKYNKVLERSANFFRDYVNGRVTETSIGLPFEVYLPCKGGYFETWEEVQSHAIRMPPAPEEVREKPWRAVKVVSMEGYLRELTEDERTVARFKERRKDLFTADILVVHLRYPGAEKASVAVIIHQNNLKVRGWGFIP